MKLNQDQQETIKQKLKKYILDGSLDREQGIPILISSRDSDVWYENDAFLESLKAWIENISGKSVGFVVGVDNGKSFLGLTIKPTNNSNYCATNEYSFVIELKGACRCVIN